MTRTILLLTTIMLGWINIPAQALLLSSNQNLWPIMSQHFTIPADIQKTDVQKQIDLDLRHPKYIQRLTQNARPYLYYILQETEKKHMPAELALLPMIESDYIPKGTSDVGAAGLWQLMPSIANDYGVKINSLYDGRRSTTVSTKVALSFLSYLYQQFDHNWLLALAAYNAGPGTVMAAIHYNEEHGRPTNFWSLPLPEQTKVYIPKLLALAAIIQHPGEYGIHLSPVPNKPVASVVTIKKQMPIEKIATLAHTSVSTVKKLNPALKGTVTPPHQIITVMLPASKKPVFEQHMKTEKTTTQKTTVKSSAHHSVAVAHHTAAHHTTLATSTHTYTVRRGDNLREIAVRYHTTIPHLMHVNHLSHSLLQVGEHLKISKA